MSFIFDLIYNGFSNVLQFIGEYRHHMQIFNLIKLYHRSVAIFECFFLRYLVEHRCARSNHSYVLDFFAFIEPIILFSLSDQ